MADSSHSLNRVIVSGGGTGGHIHPALAIADEIKRRHPHCYILFVGTKGRMEMEKVPAARYSIKGLWITGVDRNWRSLRNWLFPFNQLDTVPLKIGLENFVRETLIVRILVTSSVES